jgi:hypothetical protein
MGRRRRLALWGLALLAIGGCGKGKVDITNVTYVPKIVLDGTLIPGKQVNDIAITRNLPLDASVDINQLALTSAVATITDTAGTVYPLSYDSGSQYFYQNGLTVRYGETYRLDVSASIDGHLLQASAVTTVPDSGFALLLAKSRLDTLTYRQRDGSGNLLNFHVTFDRTPGNQFYALSITALDADTTSFIYDNAFYDYNAADVMDAMDELKYGFNWIQNAPPGPGESDLEVFWFHVNFYGDYRGVVYAGDRNFRDWLVTQENVQEIDGNFHEATMHIEGDGIGYFGSAIADTVYFTVIR